MALLDEVLLFTLAGVVRIAFYSADSDDRQQDVVAHAGALLGGEKVARGGAEVRERLVTTDRWCADGIHHRVDTVECPVQTLPRGQIDTQRTADACDFVPAPL